MVGREARRGSCYHAAPMIVGWLTKHLELILIALTLAATIALLLLARKQERRETAAEKWRAKFDGAVGLVSKIHSAWLNLPTGQTNAYGFVFDLELRGRIESYLVSIGPSHPKAQPRLATREQLFTPEMRKTITDVLAAIEKFKR